MHATAAPHWPVASHVWTPLPEHRDVVGVQTPPHAPPVHANGQALAAPQAPSALQVSRPLLTHWAVPGTQTPTQAPWTQAEFTHATGSPHVLLEPHVCRPCPEHWWAPLAQLPAH